ncbi:MAG: hypothetical protein J6S23_04560 [Clostridia bacterium]|nr:hypothetical protein [Clostridia bacterium]
MKKFLVLFFTVCLFLTACGMSTDGEYAAPENGIFNAPTEFYLEWDIPSVRDISVVKDGCYSMPVYKFETLDELLHLKDIVGMEKIGNEINNTDYCYACGTEETCKHDEYNEEFFEYYTLLVGWHQYAGVVIPTHTKVEERDALNDTEGETEGEIGDETQDNNGTPVVAKYEIGYDGSITVYLQGASAEGETQGQWILVAVPKKTMADCDSIAFLVELPAE